VSVNTISAATSNGEDNNSNFLSSKKIFLDGNGKQVPEVSLQFLITSIDYNLSHENSPDSV